MNTIDRRLLRNCTDGVELSKRSFQGLALRCGERLVEKTTLGQALIERRIELGIDKRKAATLIGVARSTYAAYEMDSRRLSVDGLPALRAFLDVAVEDLLELYGATCIAQARITLLRDLFISDQSTVERTPPSAMLVKNVRENEISVVERVFFDVVTAKGHGVAPVHVNQPSAAPSPLRAPTSSVLGRFDESTRIIEEEEPIKRKYKDKNHGKKKRKKQRKKEEVKARKKDKGKNLGKRKKKDGKRSKSEKRS